MAHCEFYTNQTWFSGLYQFVCVIRANLHEAFDHTHHTEPTHRFYKKSQQLKLSIKEAAKKTNRSITVWKAYCPHSVGKSNTLPSLCAR